MKTETRKPAWLLLEDGTYLTGLALGAHGTIGGEICFNTGMTGYQEIFTDPSYHGQVIITTVSHVGNYGTHLQEVESSKVQFSGLICNQFSDIASRRDSAETLDSYLAQAGRTGISNIDTRSLVRLIRNKGAMNVVVSTESGDLDFLKGKLAALPNMLNLELSSVVTTPAAYSYGPEHGTNKVAVLDLGIKKGILDNLAAQNLSLKVFPAQTTFSEMQAWGADAYFISNGPGDPGAMPYAVKTIQDILAQNKPLFGICLGHQLLGMAVGLKTYKMHNGHRGINHPVKNLMTGRSEITSQNHGFAVSMDGLENHPEVQLTHINLNDNTVEGIRLKNKPAFSVQYHPESNPGPHDSRYLFSDFKALIKAQN